MTAPAAASVGSNGDVLLQLSVEMLRYIQRRDLVGAWAVSERIMALEPNHPATRAFRSLIREDVARRGRAPAAQDAAENDADAESSADEEPSSPTSSSSDGVQHQEDEEESADDVDDAVESSSKTPICRVPAPAASARQRKPEHLCLVKKVSSAAGRPLAPASATNALPGTGADSCVAVTSVGAAPPQQQRPVVDRTTRGTTADDGDDEDELERAARAEVQRRLALGRRS